MKLKEKKIPYNVKLLRGYGVSINLKNSKIILKNGLRYAIGEQEKEEFSKGGLSNKYCIFR